MEKINQLRETINEHLERCLKQQEILLAVKNVLKQVVRNGNIIHMFGTGHSHAIAEEFFYRAGGLACVNAMLEEPLMVHVGAEISSLLERTEKLAELILRKHNPSPQDALIIFSNSGINTVPVEIAIQARERGIPVIAFTSVESNSSTPPRRNAGKHLYEVSDYVLDTKVPYGDAAIELSNGLRIAPVSSIISSTLVHGIFAQFTQELVEEGFEVPIYTSANIPGGDERNEKYLSQYRSRIRNL